MRIPLRGCLALAVCLASICVAEQRTANGDLTLASHTPLFSSLPPTYDAIWRVLQQSAAFRVRRSRRVFMKSQFGEHYTPIVRPVRMVEVEGTRGKWVWASPDIRARIVTAEDGSRKGELQLLCRRSPWFCVAALCALAVGLLMLCRAGRLPDSAGLFLLAIASAMACLGAVGAYYCGWGDFQSYLGIGRALLEGRKPVGFPHPVGWPLLQMPILLAAGRGELLEVGQAVTFFNACVVHPLISVFLYLLARNLTRRRAGGLLASGLFLAAPWLTVTYRWGFPKDSWGWVPDGGFLGFTRFCPSFAAAHAHDLRLYRIAQWLGLNALSDSAALVLLLAALFCLTRPRAGIGSHAVAGLLLGFGATVRVSNVFVIPAVAACCLTRLSRDEIRGPLRCAAALLGCFLLGVLPQVADNVWLSGNPFRLPYHLYDPRGSKGFVAPQFIFGLRYLATLHFQLLCAVGLALLYGRFVRWRLTVSLVLVTYFGFYAGYAATGDEEVRFVLPALAFGLLALALWLAQSERLPRPSAIAMTLAVALAVVLNPVGTGGYQPIPLDRVWAVALRVALPAVVFGLAWLVGDVWRALRWGLAAALYASGVWLWPVLLIVSVCIWDVATLARRLTAAERSAGASA